MKYSNVIKGIFEDRPNRFIAHVWVNGVLETVHVKNTGRCKELLLPGSTVILEDCQNPNRKTRYDLIAVYKENLGLVNIDSQAPNKVVAEWLAKQNYDYIKPEYKYGNSRVDFYMEKNNEKYLLEVKGCTLEIDGIGYFPDAPTERGIKHLKELEKAVLEGKQAYVVFVIQMNQVHGFTPNDARHAAFGDALRHAASNGVKVLAYDCIVGEDSLILDKPIKVRL